MSSFIWPWEDLPPKSVFSLGDHLVAEVNLDDLVRKELYAHYGDGDDDDGNDDDDRQV